MTEKLKKVVESTRGKKTHAVALGLLLLAAAALAGFLPENMRSEQIVGAATVLVALGLSTLRMAVSDIAPVDEKEGTI